MRYSTKAVDFYRWRNSALAKMEEFDEKQPSSAEACDKIIKVAD
jgi:hypothetical protein